jgi:hypothetical protein
VANFSQVQSVVEINGKSFVEIGGFVLVGEEKHFAQICVAVPKVSQFV